MPHIIPPRRLHLITRLTLCAAFVLLRVAPAGAQAPLLAEAPMTWLSPPALAAHAVDQDWIELVLPEDPYVTTVDGASGYTVTSAGDSRFAAGVTPALVQHRHFPERAPYKAAQGGDLFTIEVTYRVFLKVPVPLQEGETYTVSAPGVVSGGPFTFTFDPAVPNDAIHVNQVAYLAGGPKVAYLSAWTGEGTVDFGAATTFQLVNDATQSVVFTGSVSLSATAATEPLSQSNVYALDFSSFSGEGSYHLYVPTVGSSFGFRVGQGAFHDIGYTVLRGLTMQRDGDQGLTPAVTHWSRPASHLDDAILESTGQHVDLTGGHMDAGDRGKYPYHTADVSVALLSAIALFPTQVEAFGESMQIRESSNGIPDLVDEAVYELEFLRKVVMNTPKDGTVPFYLRPQNYGGSGGYELFAPLTGSPNRKLYDQTMGPNRSETLYAAGALAMAYNTPLLQKYLPSNCTAYLAAAKRAFAGFVAHNGQAGYFLDQGWYDVYTAGPHFWSDEMLVAATNLYQATGDPQYLAWIQSEMPADLTAVRRWGWSTGGPWIPAFLALYQVTQPGLEAAMPGIHGRALAAITNWASAALGSGPWPYDVAFGAPIPWDVYTNVGWYFTGQQAAYPLMVGYGVTQSPTYLNALVSTWSYLLGTNPLSRTFVTGLGAPRQRPRWMVNELAIGQWMSFSSGNPAGWSEPPPGIPVADVQNGQYDSGVVSDAYNLSRMNQTSPTLSAYPVLYRYHDSWSVSDEFTVDIMARQAASLVPLLGTATGMSECAVVQRGTVGNVSDVQIASNAPEANVSTIASASVGGAPASEQQVLMWFDLGFLPPGARVDGATLTLSAASASPAELDVHLVTAPWAASSVTWSSFDQSFSPAVASSVSYPASFAGSTAIDVTNLATSWVTGQNLGLLLEQPGTSLMTIATSEAAAVAARPELTLCYSTPSFSDSFTLPDGQSIDGFPGSNWLGRYAPGRPSGIAEQGHAKVVDWGTLTTARSFVNGSVRYLHFSVRLLGGQADTVTIVCDTTGYIGATATYDGSGTVTVLSNNLGYAPQEYQSSFAVNPQDDGTVVVDFYLRGTTSEVHVTDGVGVQGTGSQYESRFNGVCQSGGFQMVLGYFGVYDDVLIEQVSAVP